MTRVNQILALTLSGTLRMLTVGTAAAFLSLASFSQTPSSSPAATEGDGDRFNVSVSTEIGGRWVDVKGDENKFRSDLNYRSGFRFFDSSILIEDKSTGFRGMDSALFTANGWGADPSGSFRANVERTGIYKFDANVRRVALFNNLRNHAIGDTRINYHNYDTKRNFGDFDLTIFPESPTLRLRIGGGYNAQSDPFTFTSRASNVFPIQAQARAKAWDFRAGADARVLGFNLSGTFGYRGFEDRTSYKLSGPDEGDQVDTRVILEMERRNPISGHTKFGVLSVQRTFANRFDFTAKIIESRTSMVSNMDEFVTYRVGTTLTRDQYSIIGDASRPQTRADLGMTWRATDKFRLSNTSTYDAFHIDGSLYSAQNLVISTNPSLSFYYNITRYKRFQNTIEGDYQFNNRVAVNVGYRYTTREVELANYTRNIRTNVVTLLGETVDNTTHTVIAGAKVKPLKNWSIYADVEKGKADNVFTRAGNADFTNFRIRNLMRFNKFSASVSFITKDNEIPTDTSRSVPRITDVSSRTFSATLDWMPVDEFNLSGGYNYFYLNSRATINFVPTFVDALSEYFVRDNYVFVDATVRPHRRVTLYGSYRWNKDPGHGTVPALAAPYLLGSYPIDFKSPEVRASVRLNRHVDWNVGYQYYDYKEEPVQSIQWGIPFQNYRAHMPYMSLRIYLGKGADR